MKKITLTMLFLALIFITSCKKENDQLSNLNQQEKSTTEQTNSFEEQQITENNTLQDKSRVDWTGTWSSLSDMISPSSIIIKRNGGQSNVKIELYTLANDSRYPSLILKGYIIPSTNKLIIYKQQSNIRVYQGEGTIISTVPTLRIKLAIKQTSDMTGQTGWAPRYITPSFLNEDNGDMPHVFLNKIN